MKQYKGMGRVFSFTLIQQVRQKGWRTTTLLLALACLIIPIVSLTAAAQHQKNAAPDQNVTIWESYDQDVLDSAGLTSRQQELLTVRVDVSVTGGRTDEGQAADVLSMVLPFVSLMHITKPCLARSMEVWPTTGAAGSLKSMVITPPTAQAVWSIRPLGLPK